MQEKVTEIAEQITRNAGFLLIEVSLRGDDSEHIIEIYVDSLKGISVDECAYLSREITSVIEKTSLITSKYRLDISSPGIERSLKFLEQYPKHLHRKFELELIEPLFAEDAPDIAGTVISVTGKLLKLEGGILIFSLNNKEININFNNIKTARVLISF
ncbi:MAG: hypothetical protein WCJ01_04040 [Ignavibacteria bacterium]